MNTHPRPIVLIILDGFGHRESPQSNAIASARTPCLDTLWQNCPHTTLIASGSAVGLPEGQMGNSEVGHLTMGAGRTLYQDLPRISESIQDSSFDQNKILSEALDKVITHGKTLHILGLISDGGVHSHEEHIHALIRLAKIKQVPNIMVHAFLDGRDTPPQSAMKYLAALDACCASPIFESYAADSNMKATRAQCRIGTLCGRYYAMDRDKRFERTEQCYRLLTENVAPYQATTAIEGLNQAYARGETDEFVSPTVIGAPHPIQSGDVVIFMNFRADRARQLSNALTHPQFNGFKRVLWPQLAEFVTLTNYGKDLQAQVLFPTVQLHNMLGAYLEQNQMRQLRIAETEKYAHVTYFFNGGRDTPYQNETRIMIPSPLVPTYDLCSEMSAPQITEQLIEAINAHRFDVIVCNFANADMLGHTGHFDATVKSIETLDVCLEAILKALKAIGGEAIITADHGNAECMFDETTGQPHTAHTLAKVPFIYVGRPAKIIQSEGTLADIAPTLLLLLDLKLPMEMTGASLISLSED